MTRKRDGGDSGRWPFELSGALLVSLAVVACASSVDDRSSTAGTSGAVAGANAGGTGGAVNGGSPSMSGGSAGALGGGSAIADGGVPTRAGCDLSLAGAFRAPKTLMTAPIGDAITSLVLSPDQGELFFAHRAGNVVNGVWHYRHSVRGYPEEGQMFGVETNLPELDVACAASDARSLDLSQDRLRAYLHCYAPGTTLGAMGLGSVHMAERATLAAPFALDNDDWGTTGTGIALSADELNLYTAGDLSTPVATQSPQFYTRADRSSPFADPQPIPGLEATGVVAPFVTVDGLNLIGSQQGALVAAHRQSTTAAFGPLETIFTPEGDVWALSPVPAFDCSSLYYVEQPRNTDSPALVRMVTRPIDRQGD